MTDIKLKRVYNGYNKDDGYRVLVDHLWPRGIKKESLNYDLWAKEITPSPDLRKWFHENTNNNWEQFVFLYEKELSESQAVNDFTNLIKQHNIVTLLFASKNEKHNHALILKWFLDKKLLK